MDKIFTPFKLGQLTLNNRLVMAPMTRSRAEYDGTPADIAVEYYAQRAGVGLTLQKGRSPAMTDRVT